ncbi:uncharacterized transporter slc-17.2 [Aplysia californica]|uniref:Uncharacterized transporter slc-17.2 n=1 Tax=Aplysia californica TaxID=6500 RepID=A0ABM0JK55_APLCA|nr:uncharacterized transporter slc-17.2 [Aplysia californica]
MRSSVSQNNESSTAQVYFLTDKIYLQNNESHTDEISFDYDNSSNDGVYHESSPVSRGENVVPHPICSINSPNLHSNSIQERHDSSQKSMIDSKEKDHSPDSFSTSEPRNSNTGNAEAINDILKEFNGNENKEPDNLKSLIVLDVDTLHSTVNLNSFYFNDRKESTRRKSLPDISDLEVYNTPRNNLGHIYKKRKSDKSRRGSIFKNRSQDQKDVSSFSSTPRQALAPQKESFYSKYTSCRWRLAYMCFLARFIQTALRQLMGVAVLGMTFPHEIPSRNATSNFTSYQTVPKTIPEFTWSSVFEGIILSSFNIGAIVTPALVGYLTTRYGGRLLMSLCLLFGGLSTVALPPASRANNWLIVVLRVITGLSLSGTDSLIQAMWAEWAPVYEKASLASCAYSGLSVAGVLTFFICGYLGSIGGEGYGWPYIFYMFGSLCILFSPVWFSVVRNTPYTHPSISKREKSIIYFNKKAQVEKNNKPLNTPWRKVMRSPAVWAILTGHVTHKWVLSFMLSYMPRYFADLFDFNFEMVMDWHFSCPTSVLDKIIRGGCIE